MNQYKCFLKICLLLLSLAIGLAVNAGSMDMRQVYPGAPSGWEVIKTNYGLLYKHHLKGYENDMRGLEFMLFNRIKLPAHMSHAPMNLLVKRFGIGTAEKSEESKHTKTTQVIERDNTYYHVAYVGKYDKVAPPMHIYDKYLRSKDGYLYMISYTAPDAIPMKRQRSLGQFVQSQHLR